MAAKAATKTTAITPPAKAPRVRKPKLVDAPANAEELALSKLVPVASPPLKIEDFALAEAEAVHPSVKKTADQIADLQAALLKEQERSSELVAEAVEAHKTAAQSDARERAAVDKAGNLETTIADLRRSLQASRDQASTYSRQIDEAHAQFPPLQRQFNDVEAQLLERTEELRVHATTIAELQAVIKRADSHVSILRASHIRRKRRSLHQRILQVFFPERFDSEDADLALRRIRDGLVRGPEAEALCGIRRSEGDLGELAMTRLATEGRA